MTAFWLILALGSVGSALFLGHALFNKRDASDLAGGPEREFQAVRKLPAAEREAS